MQDYDWPGRYPDMGPYKEAKWLQHDRFEELRKLQKDQMVCKYGKFIVDHVFKNQYRDNRKNRMGYIDDTTKNKIHIRDDATDSYPVLEAEIKQIPQMEESMKNARTAQALAVVNGVHWQNDTPSSPSNAKKQQVSSIQAIKIIHLLSWQIIFISRIAAQNIN